MLWTNKETSSEYSHISHSTSLDTVSYWYSKNFSLSWVHKPKALCSFQYPLNSASHLDRPSTAFLSWNACCKQPWISLLGGSTVGMYSGEVNISPLIMTLLRNKDRGHQCLDDKKPVFATHGHPCSVITSNFFWAWGFDSKWMSGEWDQWINHCLGSCSLKQNTLIFLTVKSNVFLALPLTQVSLVGANSRRKTLPQCHAVPCSSHSIHGHYCS